MPIATTTEKAGWWTRALAIFIDGIGLAIIGSVIGSIVAPGGGTTSNLGLTTLIDAVYFTYFWSKAGGGQTIGSRALHIRVVKTDGSLLDYTGSFVRFIGYLISLYCLAIGLIWAAFDAQKQGWHDKIAGTYVVKA